MVLSAVANAQSYRTAPIWEGSKVGALARRARIASPAVAQFEAPAATLVIRVAMLVTQRGLSALRSAIDPSHAAGITVGSRDELIAYVMALNNVPFTRSAATTSIRLQLAATRTLAKASACARCDERACADYLKDIERRNIGGVPLHAWRRSQRADLVVVLDDMERGPEALRIRGLAPRLPRRRHNGRLDFARIALVDARAAMTRYTIAHEIGHLLGLDHAPAFRSSESLASFASASSAVDESLLETYARGWQSPALRLQTIMGDLGPGRNGDYDIAPIWSEPGVGWFGETCARDDSRARGVHGVADEARFIAEMAPRFVAWRQRRASAQ